MSLDSVEVLKQVGLQIAKPFAQAFSKMDVPKQNEYLNEKHVNYYIARFENADSFYGKSRILRELEGSSFTRRGAIRLVRYYQNIFSKKNRLDWSSEVNYTILKHGGRLMSGKVNLMRGTYLKCDHYDYQGIKGAKECYIMGGGMEAWDHLGNI